MKNKKCFFWFPVLLFFFLPVVLGLVFFLAALPVHADEPVDQTEYWGNIARGMGGAYTAAGGDIGGISYNPANSATIVGGQFTTDYNQLSQLSVDVNNTALAGAYRGGDFVHGFALYRTDLKFDFGNFQYTSGLELDYTDDIFYYNLGMNLNEYMHIGSNIKYYNVATDVEDGNASGYGVDLGLMQFVGDQVTFGAAIKNIISDKEWDSGTSEDVPLEVRMGLRVRPVPEVAVEGNIVYGENPGFRSLNIGGEWWLWRRFEDPDPMLRRAYFRRLQRHTAEEVQFGLALRGGLEVETAGSRETSFSAGLGMQFGDGYLNYSFQQHDDFDNQHFFGLSVNFGVMDDEADIIEPRTEVQIPESPEEPVLEAEEEDTWDITRRPGLLYWEAEGLLEGFDVRRLESELEEFADYDVLVFSENPSIQQGLLGGTLSSRQIEQLMEQTDRDSLVTGEVELGEDEQYRASAVITTIDDRHELEVTAATQRELYSELAEQLNAYLQ